MTRVEIDLDANDNRIEIRTVSESTTPRETLSVETKIARIIKNELFALLKTVQEPQKKEQEEKGVEDGK